MSFDAEYETDENHERRIVRCRERTCNARIIFLPTATGKSMPVDADSVDPADQEYDTDKHESHFGTCKKGDQFRRAR